MFTPILGGQVEKHPMAFLKKHHHILQESANIVLTQFFSGLGKHNPGIITADHTR